MLTFSGWPAMLKSMRYLLASGGPSACVLKNCSTHFSGHCGSPAEIGIHRTWRYIERWLNLLSGRPLLLLLKQNFREMVRLYFWFYSVVFDEEPNNVFFLLDFPFLIVSYTFNLQRKFCTEGWRNIRNWQIQAVQKALGNILCKI